MPTPEELAQLVFYVRAEKVMFDADLAKLYGVTTKALNQAMARNKTRFPEDFAFRLTGEEFSNLKSQIVTASIGPSDLRSQTVTASPDLTMRSQVVTASRRNVGDTPYAFTEQGVAMNSSVLRSLLAVE